MPLPSRIIYAARPKIKKPFPKKTLFAVAALLGSAAIAGGLVYLARLPYLRVGPIEIRGAMTLPPQRIEAEIRQELAGPVFRFLPRDNFFLVSAESIERRLRGRFPQIETVNVGKRFPNRLIVAVGERQLWGVYCERPDETKPPRTCFYLDTHGVAYSEVAAVEGWLLPVIYAPVLDGDGGTAVAPATLEFYSRAREALAVIDAHLLAATVSTSTPDDIRLSLAEGWELWVSTNRPVGEWLTVLRTVLEKEISDRRGELEYVDLRFGNKVFYKYR